MTSLKTISLAVAGDTVPLVRTVPCRTVGKTDSYGIRLTGPESPSLARTRGDQADPVSMGLVVRRCHQVAPTTATVAVARPLRGGRPAPTTDGRGDQGRGPEHASLGLGDGEHRNQRADREAEHRHVERVQRPAAQAPPESPLLAESKLPMPAQLWAHRLPGRSASIPSARAAFSETILRMSSSS